IRRSTLSDANRRRPSAIFAEAFAELSAMAACALPRQGNEVLRLIDATPIPLTSLHKWAEWNGRTRGLKTHVIYDPDADRPVHLEITAATVNDAVAGRRQPKTEEHTAELQSRGHPVLRLLLGKKKIRNVNGVKTGGH